MKPRRLDRATILEKLRLIDEGLADDLRGSAGMRNVIVHTYTKLDLTRVADAIPSAVEGYRRYVRQVTAFLEEQGGGDETG